MTDRELLAWLSGALEPSRARLAEDEVRVSPDLQARAHLLTLRLAEVDAPSRWRLPPPGLALRPGFGMRAAPVDVMGAPRGGDRVELRLPEQADANAVVVVVLSRDTGDWRVRFPLSPGELTRLSEFPMDAGDRVVEVTLDPVAGRQRWAVALAAPPVEWDEGWSQLREEIDEGVARVATVAITVG